MPPGNASIGEDPNVVGRTIELNQTPYSIVRHAADFRWPAGIDLWTPLGLADDAIRRQQPL